MNVKKLGLLGGALLLGALVIMGSHLGAVTAVAEDRAEWPELPPGERWEPLVTAGYVTESSGPYVVAAVAVAEDRAEWPELPPGERWEPLVTAGYVTESSGPYVVAAVAVAEDRAEWPELHLPPDMTWQHVGVTCPEQLPPWRSGVTGGTRYRKDSEIPGFSIVVITGATSHGPFDCISDVLESREVLGWPQLPGGYFCSAGLGLSTGFHILEVPPAIEEAILRAVDGDHAEVIYFNRVEEDLYSALVVAAIGGKVSFLEVIIDGDEVEVKDVEPVLIDEKFTEQVIVEGFNVENKYPAAAAKIVATTGTRSYELHLTATGSDIRRIIAWTVAQAEDGYGREVARVWAVGEFLVHVGEAVLLVIDHSYYTAHWGWKSDWFTSAATYCCRLAFVQAAGNFYAPPGIGGDVTMGATVGVCYWGLPHHFTRP